MLFTTGENRISAGTLNRRLAFVKSPVLDWVQKFKESGGRIMTRAELQRQIAELDRQINEEFAKASSGTVGAINATFPKGMWSLAILCGAWYALGDQLDFLVTYHEKTKDWAMYGAAGLAVIAFLQTIMYFLRRNPSRTSEYRDATSRSQELQAQRRELQTQMKDLEG